MSELATMLRLSADRRQVLDQDGQVRYEARELDGQTVYVEPGMDTDLGACAETGVKMACLREDGAGNCQEWATISVCLRWPDTDPRRPAG